MKNRTQKPKKIFYKKLAERIRNGNLDFVELKKTIKNHKLFYHNLSVTDFLRDSGLTYIKGHIVDLKSVALIREIYQASFKNGKNGFLKRNEIKKITENYYGFSLPSRAFNILISVLENEYSKIYERAYVEGSDTSFKHKRFVDRSEIEVKRLFGDIDKNEYDLYKKIIRER